MIVRTEHLVILNNKNRIQHVLVKLSRDDFNGTYSILRSTNQFNGKIVDQCPIIIKYGKAKRTVQQQAGLQFNHALKFYLNKGYKRLLDLTTTPYESLSENEIKVLLGETFTTYQNGAPRPMLCKSYDTCTNDITEKCWFVSREISGCRALFYYKDNEIHVSSRGGKSYDVPTTHLRTNKKLINLFKNNPNLILDGEIYKHDVNYPLQKISKLCRLEKWDEECNNLEYWVYDFVSDKPFSERYEILMEFKNHFLDEDKIKFMDHEYICGFYKIKRRHDQYVKEGYGGLIMRNPDKEYGVNKRSSRYMVKMKFPLNLYSRK